MDERVGKKVERRTMDWPACVCVMCDAWGGKKKRMTVPGLSVYVYGGGGRGRGDILIIEIDKRLYHPTHIYTPHFPLPVYVI